MKIVTVIPLQKGSSRGELSYFTAKDISLGSIVMIPVRNKKTLGLVISSSNVSNAKSKIKDMDFNLKKIAEVKATSIFSKEYLESVLKLGRYFATTKNNAAASMIPSIMKENYDKIANLSPTPLLSGERRKGEVNLQPEKLLLQESSDNRISIYKTLIRESFALNKSVFILLPTERDIENFNRILSRGIEQFTFTVHGGLNAKKIMHALEQIMVTAHPVLILGTGIFLSIPRSDIGTIIVEHESSGSYKMISRPHFDLRIFAEIFASKIRGRLILGDSLLRFETIERAETDGIIPMHPLSFRINWEGEIKISGRQEKKFKILIEESIEAIKDAIKRKENIFIFSLRKGLATMTICKDCGELLSCERCRSPLVLYLSEDGKKRIFVCNRCEKEEGADTACAMCRSWNLMPLGIGTDTVIEEAKKNFPKIKILKLDKESAKTAKSAEKIIKEWQDSPGSILVGTELALFYFGDKKAHLSIIASFDSLWSIPNFKMSEKIVQLILSIMSKTGEKLIIQTKNENDPAILAVQSGNLLSFIREELSDRKALGYRPFKRFIKIKHFGNKIQTAEAKEMLRETFKDYNPEIFSGFVARLKGKYVTNALVKLDPKKWSLSELSPDSSIDENLLNKLLSLPLNFEISVDPEDLL